MSRPRTLLAFLTPLAALAVFGPAACAPELAPEDIGRSPLPLERHRVGSYAEVSLAPAGADAPAQRATGALFVPHGGVAADGVTPVGGSCGVTFVSPVHANTASHCVAGTYLDAATATLKVQAYRPRRDLDWARAAPLAGAWPNFTHLALGWADGYHVDEYTCRVARRCGDAYGPYACDSPDADVSLLRCDGRPGDRHGYVNVAETDAPGVEVRMAWKHEIYDVPEADTAAPAFQHYSTYQADRAQNYHYFLGRHQLLPLMSKPFAPGVPRVKTAPPTDARVATTLRGCHGTSGSGVFQKNAATGDWELLGPAVTASGLFSTLPGGATVSRLCHPTDSATQAGISYMALRFTHDATEGVCELDPPDTVLGRLLCHRLWLKKWANIEFKPWPWPECPACGGWRWARVFDEPLAVVSPKQALVAPMAKPAEGQRYRFHARAVGLGAAPAVVRVKLDGKTLLVRELAAPAGAAAAPGEPPTAPLDASFVAAPKAQGKLEIEAEPGSGEVGVFEISLVAEDAPNAFDTFLAREGVGLQGADPASPALVAMRFSGDGEKGFAADLAKGERLVLTRLGLPPGETWRASFRVLDGEAGLRCGLVFEDGKEASAPCPAAQGRAEVTLAPDPKAQPVAFFIRAESGDVRIDDVAIARR